MPWTDEEVLAAVRRHVAAPAPRPSWDFVGAEVVDRAVRVTFTLREDSVLGRRRHEPGRFAVDYPLTDLPEGPSTGEECDTPDEWAVEVTVDIDEEVDTGGVWRAERSAGPEGAVLLRWRG